MSQHELAAPLPAAGGRIGAESCSPSPQADAYPPALERLLRAPPAARDDAWAAFVDDFSLLLLHAARSACAHREEAMDAYAHVLERLRANDFRRLRNYSADPRCRFTTWLVVVARRICIDLHRARYGRERRADGSAPRDRRRLRRTLEDLTMGQLDLLAVPDESARAPDDGVLTTELNAVLALVVDSLPPGDRLLLKLRFDDDLTAAQIAKVLHLPSQFQVYRRLRSVLAHLRALLSERGVDGSEP